MGRPGCRQCCDEEELVTCFVLDSKVDIVYKDSNNQKINVGLTDIRPLIRTSEDIKPENAPEDYDDFVLSESILQEIEDGDYTIVKSDQFPQIIKAYFYNDDKYCFRAFFSTTFPHVKRMEVKTKNREFFYSYKRFDFEGGDSQDYQNIQIKDLDVEIPRQGLIGFGGGFPDFVLSFSPDILDIAYQGSFGPTSGFCFNVKEELGSYLTEEELEVVEFSIFLDSEKMSEETDNLEIVNAGVFNLPISNFGKFSVYNKELTKKDTYMVLKTPSPVDLYYRDHRVVGGDFFFSDINTDFIDSVNEINKQTVIRSEINRLLKEFLEERKDWTILDSGSNDAATKQQLRIDFIEDTKEYLDENFNLELSYTKVAYIGNAEQERDDLGFKIRDSVEFVDYQEDASPVIDSIFEDDSFLELIVGEVEDFDQQEIESGIVLDFNYKLKQGDSTADMVFKDDLLSSTSLPRPTPYTHNNTYVKIFNNENGDEYSYALPRIGTVAFTPLTSKLTGIAGYREKYYISIKYKSPTGAFLNGEESFFIVNKNEVFGSIDVEQETKIGNQMFVDPSCGYIQSRTDILLPSTFEGSGVIREFINREYSIIYEDHDMYEYYGSFGTNGVVSDGDMGCVGPFETPLLYSNTYYTIDNKEVKRGSKLGGSPSISRIDSRFSNSFGLCNPNIDKEQWTHYSETQKYKKNDDGELVVNFFRYNEINNLQSKSSASDFKNHCEEILSLGGTPLYTGSVSEDLSIFSRYTHHSLNYGKFDGNSVKDKDYISQWPSKSFYTIDMEPNTSDINVTTSTNKTYGEQVINRNYSMYSGFVNKTQSFATSGLYNSGNMYSSIKVNGNQSYIDTYIPSSYHSVRYSHTQKSGYPSITCADNFKKVYSKTTSGGSNRDVLTDFDIIGIMQEYESCVAKVEVNNHKKQYWVSVFYSSDASQENGRHKKLFSYIELLESPEGAVQEYEFQAYDGGSFLLKNYKSIFFKPLAGTGTLSDSISAAIRGFFNQYGTGGQLAEYSPVWGESGPFLDSQINLGFAGITAYNIGQTGIPSRVKSECLNLGPSGRCSDWDCTTCTGNNGVLYNLNYNNFDDRSLTFLPVDSASLSLPQSGDFVGDYTISTNLKAFSASSRKRYLTDRDRNNSLLSDGWGIGSFAIKGAKFSGEYSSSLVNDSELCGYSSAMMPSEGVGGFVTTSSPGYHIYKNCVYDGNSYYYDYKYKVTSSPILRSYARHGDIVPSIFKSESERYQLFTILRETVAFLSPSYFYGPQECIQLYGPYDPKGCYQEIDDLINQIENDYPEAQFLSGRTESQEVTSYNYIPCRSTLFFVEDQEYETIDISSLPQENKTIVEDATDITRNTELDYEESGSFFATAYKLKGVNEIPFNNFVIRWSI